jgi:sorbitol-specific phosphotransferase system component IIC
MGESPKTCPIKVDCQVVVRGHQNVESQVELLVAYQQGVVDVALDDKGFGLVFHLGPLLDVSYVSEEENSLALAQADGLHNP